jgi:hypothetical protein
VRRREFIRLAAGAGGPALPTLPSAPKLSQLPLSPSAPAILDTVVGVKGAATDTRFTIEQLSQTILRGLPAPSPTPTQQTAAIVNVKDFGAEGRDRLYTNVVGGTGYPGGSASNLLSSPEDYTTWNKSNVTVIANATSDPRGNPLADAIVENIEVNVSHSVAVASASFPGGARLRYDVEVKPAARAWILIYVSGSGDGFFRTFQLSGSGVMGSSFEYGSVVLTNSSIQMVANGFYRCVIEGTLDRDITASVAVVLLQGDLLVYDQVSDPHQIYTGNRAVGVYLGQSRLYAVSTYKGTAYIAGDNIYTGVALTGGSGSGARANIIVGLGQVLDVISYCPGNAYKVGDVLSCRAADIGGTGNGFTCQVATIGNDTAAIQAAIDSGAGQPVAVFFPVGTYNIFPPDNVGSHALIVRENNVTMIGASRYTTTIQAFVSGGRHPETSWDIPTVGSAGFVWRGSAFYLAQNRQNVEWHRMRITGLCKRHNTRYPLGGPDPQVLSGGNRLGTYGDGDGWDESHHAIVRRNGYPNKGIRWIDCELDGWKGEIIGGIGDTVQAIDNKTHWQFWIEGCYIHDTHADGISLAGNTMILDNEIAWCSNGVEQGSSLCHDVIKSNHFHDHTHGVTLVVGVDTGAANTSTGQQVVTNNFFERCYRNGVFIYQFQCNVMLDDNVFVDCGVEGSITGERSSSACCRALNPMPISTFAATPRASRHMRDGNRRGAVHRLDAKRHLRRGQQVGVDACRPGRGSGLHRSVFHQYGPRNAS